MSSFLDIKDDSDLSLQNLPYGIFSVNNGNRRIGVAIGDSILDLLTVAQEKLITVDGLDISVLAEPTLNAYAALNKDVHLSVRLALQNLLRSDSKAGSILRDNKDLRDRVLIPMASAQMHLPMAIGDYTDFFVGEHHARNVRHTLPTDYAVYSS